jgi:hypothetical protein
MNIKTMALSVCIASAAAAFAAPAYAQFGGLAGSLLNGRANNAASAAAAATAAATPITAVEAPAPELLASPQPIEGSTGKYMSPFTSDGVTAGWVTKAMSVKASSAVGSMVGSYAGERVAQEATMRMASMVPSPGLGMLGQRAGKAMGASAGRAMALQAIGGEEFLKSSTDLSFNSIEEMAVFMYVNHSTHADYAKIVDATASIYPEFKTAYGPALQSATLKQ